jgi:hypothetical protein
LSSRGEGVSERVRWRRARRGSEGGAVVQREALGKNARGFEQLAEGLAARNERLTLQLLLAQTAVAQFAVRHRGAGVNGAWL